jgi:hypothetical protein
MERHYKLSDPVKKGGWGIKKFNLDELYVRFFRIAERRIAEKTGKGIVCYISNHSWISDPSFVVLRQNLLNSFDSFWIENMHGNRKISEYAPDGRTSETVFALAGFSPGIQQGVAISLWVKTGKKQKKSVLFRDDLNDAKSADRRAHLLESLKEKKFNVQYKQAEPLKENWFGFKPTDIAAHYLSWPKITELSLRSPFAGIAEDRRKALISIEREPLVERMKKYFDPKVEWTALHELGTGLTRNVPRFDALKARKLLLSVESFDETRVVRFAMRPFDTQWCYYSPTRPLWREPRPDYWANYAVGSPAVVSRFKAAKSPEGAPITVARTLCDYHMMPPNASVFPFRLKQRERQKEEDDGNGKFGSILHEAAPAYKTGGEKLTANLSPAARAYLAKLGIKNPDADAETTGLIWMHALAIGYSPAYLAENADGIQQDWPRIPLPDSKAVLIASAELGKQVAALLDAEMPVDGVTAGKVFPELVKIAVVTRLTRDILNLSLTAGWGHAGKKGVTMPGKGKMQTRAFAQDETVAALGQTTHDIYLNDFACWSNVPENVWDYTIGGYQVIKKWLSYREFALLGRALTPEEAREVTHMARRIAALILLQPELDANYLCVKAGTFDWKT